MPVDQQVSPGPCVSTTSWMARYTEPTSRSVVIAAVMVSVWAIVAFLYWAQAMLIPIALASLLTFLLTPVVEQLERLRLPRIPAVILVAVLSAALFGGLGWAVSNQLTHLAADLPAYEENIKEKLSDLRRFLRGGAIEKVQETIEEVNEELENEEVDDEGPTPFLPPTPQIQPVPVEVQPAQGFWELSSSLSPVFKGLATAGLVLVLAVFMLIKREDLLNRLISLAGIRGVAKTTKALHEAAQRISRYLLAQFIVNGSYGVILGSALWLVGVPYALLWGFLAAVFRYIPYLGPLVAAVLPISISLIHFPGWSTTFLVVGIFIVLELISNNVMEPWFYGTSVGLSEVAVIVSAVFWTMIWGPAGLVLATPLTVCFVVLGKYIPSLSVFDRLLSQQPALAPYVWLFQRLLGGHEQDAEELLRKEIEVSGLSGAVDELLLPLLVLTKTEWGRGRIEEEDQATILELASTIISRVAPEADTLSDPIERPAVVLGFPLRESDEIVLDCFRAISVESAWQVDALSAELLIAERVAEVAERSPACVCLSTLPPGDLGQARQICTRLRAANPTIKIVVGRWTTRRALDSETSDLLEAGASHVVSTVAEMHDVVARIVQHHRHRSPETTPS